MAMECSGLRYSFALLVRFSFMTICPIATGQIFIVNMTQLLVKRMLELRAKTMKVGRV